MDNIKKHLIKNKEIYLLAGIVLLFIVLPLLLLRLPSGHDYKYHMGRIYQIAQNIQHGKWFAPLYYGQINGYGYASPLFYGDILLHLPGALAAAGAAVETAMRLYIILCVSAAAFSMFFCVRKMSGSAPGALTAAVAYAFSSYMCVDFITRVALGEVQAFVFVPIAFLGFWSILFGDKKQWYLLPLGLVGVLISHTLSAVMLAAFMLVIALLFLPEFFADKKRIALVGLSAALFFALGAGFILPMCEQLASGSFRVSDGTSDTIWGTLAARAMPLWRTVWDFNLADGYDPWIPNGIGIGIFATLGVTVYAVIKKRRPSKAVLFCVLAVFTLFMISSVFPWSTFQSVFGKMQFPWRLMLFATFFAAIAAAFAMTSLKSDSAKSLFAVAVILCSLFSYSVTALPKLKTMIDNEKKGVELVENWHDGLGGAEYLPSATPWQTMQKKGSVAETNDSGIRDTLTLKKYFDKTVVSFTGKAADDAYIRLPLIMYKGYRTTDESGAEIPLSCERGYMIADISGMDGGVITVTYVWTALQTAGRIISLLTLAALIIYIIFRKKARIPCQTNTPPQEASV